MKHLLCMDFESWVVSTVMNQRNLSADRLRELDSGYTKESLEFILKKLKKYNQRITFFVVFKLEELFPGIIKRILKEGHEVGWHSYSHARINSEQILKEELEKSKSILNKYPIKGFQAPEIIFFKEGYQLLRKYGFAYSSSIYGDSDKIYKFSRIIEIPVSVSNSDFSPQKKDIVFPSSMTLGNFLKFHIPYGSSYFWSILGERFYAQKLKKLNSQSKKANFFIHNWQLIHPSSALYKKEYKKQLSVFSNPLFIPYNINVCNVFDFLLKNYEFQRCIDYIYENKEEKN
jgi:hypothetical protein